ncbi:hypothetical protein BsWGS_11997 [Bradybaena similaris]
MAEGAQLDYTGKQVILQGQLPIVEAAFTLSSPWVKWATELVRSFEEHQKTRKPHLSTLEIGSCQENLRSSIQSELHEKIGGHPNSPAHRCGQSAFIYSSQSFI